MSILMQSAFVTVSVLCNVVIHASPQLDLPPLPPPSSARPEIMINSYTDRKLKDEMKSNSNFMKFDRDRSDRFG